MAKKKPYDPLAEARAKPKSVVTIAVNPAGARNMGLGEFAPYPAFPQEILACTNLEELEIFRGIAWNGDASIPAGIGKLTKLVKLSLGGIGVTELPAELGKLTKLETLELYYNEQLRALPDTIGKLVNLRELACGYCEALAELPRAIGKLRQLRTLNLANTKLRTVPAELWRCTALETLYLPESIEELPPGIAKLGKLASLTLSVAGAASIARELPKLESLARLHIDGKGSEVPPEIGQIANLVELDLAFLGLAALPPLRLAKLGRLAIAGNQLTTVKPLLAELPKLVELDYVENPVDKKERREVDALMKLSPSKRKLGAPQPAPVVTRPAGAARPEHIGKVASINASLIMVAGDASVVAKWKGIDQGDADDDTDFDRACAAVKARPSGMIDCAGQPVLALSLEMGAGIADIFRVGKQLVLVEGIGEYDEDELFLEWLASPPAKGTRSLAQLALPTRTLALLPSTDLGTRAPKLAAHAIEKFGDDNCGRAIGVGSATVTFSLEKPTRSSWGEARRCFVSPA